MSAQPELGRERFSRRVGRESRTARLLGWTVMVAVCCFLLWIVSGMAKAEDPKAAARGIGQAGAAAAGRDREERRQRRHRAGLCRDKRAGSGA